MPNWFAPAAAAFVFWGLWAFLPKLTTRYIGPRSALVYEAVGGLLVALVVLALLGLRTESDARGIALALATGVLGVLGAFAYLYAVSRGPVARIAVVTALYPALTIALAWLLLDEPVSLRQGLGMVLALVALVLISG